MRANFVVDKLNPHALLGFGDQPLLQFVPQLVFMNDEELNKDIFLGVINRGEDGIKRLLAIDQQFQPALRLPLQLVQARLPDVSVSVDHIGSGRGDTGGFLPAVANQRIDRRKGAGNRDPDPRRPRLP